MSYSFYIDDVLLPVAPESLSIKINGQNEQINLINEGEVNVLKTPGLSDVSFEFMIPQVNLPFARYKNGFERASFYLNKLNDLKSGKKTFQFIVTRTMPNGSALFDTNMKVSLEEYEIKESTEQGFDLIISIEMKQYRDYGTKIAEGVSFVQPRPESSSSSPSNGLPTNYKVVSGDCLWNIAKKFYGDGNKWEKIYDANRDEIEDPNLIYPGEVFVIPK